jgi:tRNA/tmRNA/rRNA uracil-C5-methylase (TrmA/RlmC/RlmD family)
MREALRPALDRAARCDIAITLAENGLDVVVLGEVDRARLSALAALPGIARLSRGIDPEGEHELVALHRRPVIRFDGIAIEPPPHVFLQATIEGEQAIRDAMREGLDGARRVADLFSGCGGLSLGASMAAASVGAHIRSIAAFDSFDAALDVHERNFNSDHLCKEPLESLFDGDFGAKITKREHEWLSKLGRVDLVLAGPPCQGHSDLNNHSRRDDPKNQLYFRCARVAEVL